MLRPATPLTILLFAAFALLLISVISTPIIKGIALASFGGYDFGVFGFCKGDDCSPFEIGYNTKGLFSESQSATFDLPEGTRTTLSSILILHPIAALFTLIMTCLSAAAHLHSPSHSPRYLLGVFILSILTLILTLLSFLIDVLLFVPHMAWGSYLVLAATVLVAASGIVSCAMRRTLVSRKARAKRIAENAEMNGENFYNRQATEPVADLPPNPTMIVNGAPGADKLPAFAAFDMQKKDPERTSDERLPLTARTPTDRSPDGQLPMRQGSNDRYGNPPNSQGRGGMGTNRGAYNGPPGRDQYGNQLPTPGGYGPGGRDQSRDRMQNGYGGNGYGPPGGPGNYRGRGGPYRGRGGPGGPGGPGYGRGGFNPQMRGGYGPPGGQGRGPPMGGMPPAGMMRGGRGPPPGYGAPQYRGESPAGAYGADGRRPMGPPSSNTYGSSDNPMGPGGGYAAYNSSESRDSLPRAESPPPLPGDGLGPVGQAIEMDATTGSPSHPPPGFGQYGNNRIRDSDSDVAGMISLQQPSTALGDRHISETSKYSSDEPYVPPRSAWAGQGRSSPLAQPSGAPAPTGSSASHRRQTSGEYFEDVDPRFAESQPRPAELQTLASSNLAQSSLTPGYTTSSNGPPLNRDPNTLGHPSGSNPHLGMDGNHSYEDLQDGSRSPAESERSNFTSVSQRGVNPRWNPQNGPGGFGQPMMPMPLTRRPLPPPQRNNDILLDTNPDFGLPTRGGRGGPKGRSPIGGGGMVPRSAYEGGSAM